MKRILILLLALGASTAAFARELPFASYNVPGQLNAHASVGWWGWPEVSGGVEWMFGKLDIGPLPFTWGVMGRAAVGFYPGNINYAAGAMATLHLGLRWNLDFSAGLGFGLYGPTAGLPVALASYSAVTWLFSRNLGLLLEAGYMGGGWGFWGVGLRLKP